MTGHPAIYFVRHGETDWNRARRFQGRTDIPLNDTGRGQAARNGAALKRLLADPAAFDYVASPLSRAVETMHIVRQGLGLDEIGFALDERLVEISFGAWEGLTWEEMETRAPDHYRAFLTNAWTSGPPEGESYGAAAQRVGDWLRSLSRDTVVVAHGGTSRVLRTLVCRLDPGGVLDLSVPQDKIILLEDGAESLL